MKLCICQLCNCGRHRCPHAVRVPKSIGPCAISEYTNKYIAYPIKPVESCKPPHKGIDAQGPISSYTTHRVDYVAPPLDKQPSCKREACYEPPKTKFDGQSTYTREYIAKPLQKSHSCKPPARRATEAKFEGEATYTSDYRKWPLEPRHPHVVDEYMKPTEPFRGLPTYTSDYIRHQLKPTQSCKPTQRYTKPVVAFDGISDYRDAYRQPMVTERAHPVVTKVCVQKATAPMEGISTHMRDYVWKTGEPGASCKPAYTGLSSEAPFQSDTTNRVDFKPWPANLKRTLSSPHMVSYELPKCKMDSDTTYHHDYIPHPGSKKAQPVEPQTCRMISTAPFKGISDYQDSFRAWAIGPRQKGFGPGAGFYQSNAPFDGRSTNKQYYVAHAGCRPAESCKPHPSVLHTGVPFDGATSYRTDYTPKRAERCPAALLNTELSPYVYAHKDENGHLLYCKTTEIKCPIEASLEPSQINLITNVPVAVAN
ncbi:unnamed protein product [Dicrocoelium dendriticum]|nr:unnamed protein product [Dicrocoelium dendriticum]